MINTPLGDIEIYIDGKQIDYSAKCLGAMDRLCPDITGRYRVEINLEPDGKEHTISCRIKDYTPSEEDDIETGENLELKSFYKDKTKLSIGMEGDSGYYEKYDYDNDYLDDGVQYFIMKDTKTRIYKFGIAWIDNFTDENEAQTWFGADPAII